MNKEWMDDSALAGIERRKLDFLYTLVSGTTGMAQKDMIPYFVTLVRKAKEDKMQFSKEEIEKITAVIRKNCTEEELKRFDKMVPKK